MIETFTGKYRFLSNFWYVDVLWDGITFPTVEHAYQASKCVNEMDRQHILKLNSPGKAKRAGQSVKCRSDWEKVKIDIMHEILLVKFNNLTMRYQLLATGDEYLQEGNTWDDTYWGRVKVGGKWVGENMLGKLLMEVREELRED